MAVALRGYTQAVYSASGAQTIALPSGTIAGDYAVLCMLEPQSGKPNSAPSDPTGWAIGPSTGNSTVWGRSLGAATVAAGSVQVQGNVAYLATFSGCGGIGRTSKNNGVQLTKVGAGLFVFVRDDTRKVALTPAGGKLGADVINGKNRSRRSNVWFIPYASTGFKKLASTNATYFTSLELLPTSAPSAPTLLAPGYGDYIDPARPTAFTFRFNHPTMPQARCNLRIREKTTPGAWQYLRADGALYATTLSAGTDASSMPMNAGQLSVGTYEWQMQTAVDDNGSAVWSQWEWCETRELNVANPPVVTGVSVSAPAGDLTPDATITRTLGAGSQVAYQARITPSASIDADASVMYDSGVTPGSALTIALPAVEWVNGSSYKAWVRIQQTGGQWSAWVSATFSVSWTAPGAPSSVTFAQGTPPTVTIAGVSGRNAVQVAYSEDGGATWASLTTAPVAGSSVVASLPIVPYGVARRYRARASNTIDGTEQWSAWVATASSYASTDASAYMVALDLSSWVKVRMRQDAARSRVESINVTYGLTDDPAPTAAVDYGPPQGWTGQTTITGVLPADLAALIAFWDANPAFWLRFGPERYGVTMHDGGAFRVARVSPIEPERVAQLAVTPRDLTFDWVEQ